LDDLELMCNPPLRAAGNFSRVFTKKLSPHVHCLLLK